MRILCFSMLKRIGKHPWEWQMGTLWAHSLHSCWLLTYFHHSWFFWQLALDVEEVQCLGLETLKYASLIWFERHLPLSGTKSPHVWLSGIAHLHLEARDYLGFFLLCISLLSEWPRALSRSSSLCYWSLMADNKLIPAISWVLFLI